MKKILAPISLLFFLAACAGDATKLIPTHYHDMSGWEEDEHASAYRVFADSCAVKATRARAYSSKTEGAVGDRDNWRRVCRMVAENPAPTHTEARRFFERNFAPVKVETESKATGTLTGYYEPIINGSRTRGGAFTTPVYGVPSDLGSRKPYFSREEIVAGAIRGRAPVLLYVDDPIMLAFLHIQGSGKVRLPDGSLVGLQYAAQNGHSFVPIGRVLKERGELPKPTMQGIRDWLRANPSQAEDVLNQNPSYVFFKLSSGSEMAKGALGLPLTPLRSIAVDDDRAAYGVPTYIDGVISDGGNGGQLPLKRLFVSQDTGGALKGPHRADIFFGRGSREEWQAGHQNAQGNVYWLLPLEQPASIAEDTPVLEPAPTPPMVMEPQSPVSEAPLPQVQ